MNAERTYPAWILVGPTAVGKSSVAHLLARRHGYAILSADSMLVYRGMDIGTAKPSRAEQDEISYRGIDCVGPDESFSTGEYLRAARDAFESCHLAGRSVVVTGGTGLYVRALICGLQASGSDPQRRAHWEARLQEEGLDALWQELQSGWPEHAGRVSDPCNPRRVIRALERAESGRLDEAGVGWGDAAALPPVVGLGMSREWLTARIEQRIDQMFEAGLAREVRHLRETTALSPTAAQAIGYCEVMAWIDGECSFEEARERMLVRTRRLAKRQRSWFRNQANVVWVDVSPDDSVESLADQVEEQWRIHGPTTVRFGP